MAYWKDKVVVITGGSAGFGLVLAQAFATAGAQVVIVARGKQQLDDATDKLWRSGLKVKAEVADITLAADVERLFEATGKEFGRIDVLVNNAGRSHRGLAIETDIEEFRALIELNFLAAVRCTQAAMPWLRESQGHIVNIGSLAAKTVSPHLGGYPASKFPLAAFSHQLRLELGGQGLHVLLVCPGPIARSDSESRYRDLAAEKGVPADAAKPGGGVKLKGLDPQRLADQVMNACERRKPELVIPFKARVLMAISQLWPRLGDWIIRKMT